MDIYRLPFNPARCIRCNGSLSTDIEGRHIVYRCINCGHVHYEVKDARKAKITTEERDGVPVNRSQPWRREQRL